MTSELLEVKPHDSVTLFLGTNSDTSTAFEISFFRQVFLVRGETEGLMVIRFIKAKNNRKPGKNIADTSTTVYVATGDATSPPRVAQRYTYDHSSQNKQQD